MGAGGAGEVGLGCRHEKERCSIAVGRWGCSTDSCVAVYSPVKCSLVGWEVEEGSNEAKRSMRLITVEAGLWPMTADRRTLSALRKL